MEVIPFKKYTLFFVFISLTPNVVKLELLSSTTGKVTLLTSTADTVPASPVHIMGKVPLRMIQGTNRHVVFGYANFLGEFYTLAITSSDIAVVRVVEESGVELLSVPDEAVISSNGTQNANNSLELSMSMANFTLKGVRFGKAHLILQLRSTDTGEIDKELSGLLPKPNVAVIRIPTAYFLSLKLSILVTIVFFYSAFDIAFGYALLVVSALTTGIMGCEIEWEPLKVIFRRPFGIVIGIGCQFIIMPLTAFLLCIAFDLPNDLAIGVLLAACSPGGGMSNMTTVVVEGHLLLSIAMTFISTCLAVGMMPLNLFIYSRHFMDTTTFPVPYDKIIVGLACLLGPLSVGCLLRRCKPSIAEKLLKVLKPACLIVVLFTMAGGMYTIRYVFTYIVPKMIICSFLLPIVAFILGGSTALLLRRPIPEVKTISIETGVQNVAIAAAVIRLTYPYPDADMVSSTVMWTMFGQFCAVTVMMCSYVFYKRLCKKSKADTSMEMEEISGQPTELSHNGIIGKPIVEVTMDSNSQTAHAHLARITQSQGDQYHQLPQTKTYSSQNSNVDAKHNRYGGYSRLLSSTSTATSSEGGTEVDAFIPTTGKKTISETINEDSLWQPNLKADKIDYSVFTDEEKD